MGWTEADERSHRLLREVQLHLFEDSRGYSPRSVEGPMVRKAISRTEELARQNTLLEVAKLCRDKLAARPPRSGSQPEGNGRRFQLADLAAELEEMARNADG